MSKPAIIVDDVSMKFNLSKEKVDSLKDYIIKSLRKEIKYNEFWALKNVSFTVEKGDRVGILGLNGAGKSTLFKGDRRSFQTYSRNCDQTWKNGSAVWNLERDLIPSIQEKRIFIYMVPCLATPKHLLMKNTTRSWNFRN